MESPFLNSSEFELFFNHGLIHSKSLAPARYIKSTYVNVKLG